MRTLLLCAVLTGMRRGELFGLRWEDVDLESHRLFIRRALWRGRFVTPKSRRSRRTIDLAPTLRAALTKLSSFAAQTARRSIRITSFTGTGYACFVVRGSGGSGFTTCATHTQVS